MKVILISNVERITRSGKKVIRGNVHDDARFPEGTSIISSPVLGVEEKDGMIFYTTRNTRYMAVSHIRH